MSNHRSRIRTIVGGCALLAVVASAASGAQATEILTVTDGTNTAVITGDGSQPLVFNSLNDLSWLSNSTWSIALAGGVGSPLVGSQEDPQLHLDAFGTGVGALTITLQDDGFLANGPIQSLTQIGGAAGDGSSVAVTSSSTLGNLTSFGPSGAGAFASSSYSSQTINGSYGLELIATITNTKLASTSVDAVVSVPEPSALALIGAAAFGCVVFLRGRRRSIVVA